MSPNQLNAYCDPPISRTFRAFPGLSTVPENRVARTTPRNRGVFSSNLGGGTPHEISTLWACVVRLPPCKLT